MIRRTDPVIPFLRKRMVGKIWLFNFYLLLLQNKRTNPN